MSLTVKNTKNFFLELPLPVKMLLAFITLFVIVRFLKR